TRRPSARLTPARCTRPSPPPAPPTSSWSSRTSPEHPALSSPRRSPACRTACSTSAWHAPSCAATELHPSMPPPTAWTPPPSRREELLDILSSGNLQFADVRQYTEERSVRHRATVAVVVGRTRMVMRYHEDEMTAESRYTHVYTRENGRWRLMSAQGTPVAA